MRRKDLTSAHKREALKNVVSSLITLMEKNENKGEDVYLSVSNIAEQHYMSYRNDNSYGNITPSEVVVLMDEERAHNVNFAKITRVARIKGRTLIQTAYGLDLARKDELLKYFES